LEQGKGDQLMPISQESVTAFQGSKRVASGDLKSVVRELRMRVEGGQANGILIFDDQSGESVQLDLSETIDQIILRLNSSEHQDETANQPGPRGPGRPRLGVVGREVTLLPRHWEWLSEQPGGASVALRKLVDAARTSNQANDRIRRAQEATYRFMTAIAGDRPGYEEALRALYSRDCERFNSMIEEWPADIRAHTLRLAQSIFDDQRLEGAERRS
jgi:uncharacterized protein